MQNHRILMFVGDIYEDLELWYPKLRLIEAGAEVVIAGPEASTQYQGKNGYPCQSDISISDVDASQYTGLVVPGGFMPDKLRRDSKVLDLVKHFSHFCWRLRGNSCDRFFGDQGRLGQRGCDMGRRFRRRR